MVSDTGLVTKDLAFVSSVGGMLPRISQRPVASHEPWERPGPGRERKREMALAEWRRGGRCLESPSGGSASSSVLQILVKTMIRKRSFGNPFEGSRREERSLSAPGNLLT